MNTAIIKCHQGVRSSKICGPDDMNVRAFFQTVLFLAVILVLVLAESLPEEPGTEARIPISLVLGMFFSFSFLAGEGARRKLKQSLIYYSHYILPGKNKREIEINDYLSNMATDEVRSLPKNNIKLITFIDDEKFKNITKDNLKIWVDENVGSERSIQNFMNMRVLGTSHLRMGCIYWSQLIPRSKLKVDELRLILSSCQIVDTHESLSEMPLVSQDNLEEMFSEYSGLDLTRIFTSPYKLSDYLYCVFMANKHKLALPLKSDVSEIYQWIHMMIHYLDNLKFNLPRDKEWITQLEESREYGVVEYLDDFAKLQRWGHLMTNCLRKPYDPSHRGSSEYLFGVWRDNKPFALIKLNERGAIMEHKKRANALFSHEEKVEVEAWVARYVNA